MNEFVKYLNSLNNASSSNENALAESQVSNKFYKSIYIDRMVGKYLGEEMRRAPICVILTGHAGDGKTSVIYQILKKYKLISTDSQLEMSDEVFSPEFGRKLFYVKDMSEQSNNTQIELLSKSLNITKENKSSILVSNTGPLINSFRSFLKDTYPIEKLDEFEMKLLKIMDENSGRIEELAGYNVLLINMARLDNVLIASQIIDKFTNIELWEPCQSCTAVGDCPIYNNYIVVSENSKNVKRFIEVYYRWLNETDRRLTIRQMISHLSFSFTANLDCKVVKENNDSGKLFKYHFSNLFFGYEGLKKSEDGIQIKAIREINLLSLDSKKNPADYNIFVKSNFEYITEKNRHLIENVWNNEMRRYTLSDTNLATDERNVELRKAVRRMYLLFGTFQDEQFGEIIDSIYSPVIYDFLKKRENKFESYELNPVKTMIINALYYLFVKTSKINDGDPIYLPLQREGVGMQNVQLLLGQVNLDEIRVGQIENKSEIDPDSSHYQLFISFKRIDKKYPVSILLYEYFYRVANGAVTTKLNPALSHGIDKMKTDIQKHYSYSSDDEIKLLVHTVNGNEIVKAIITDKGKIII